MTKVINSPCAASRARVDCLPYSSQSGFIDKPCSSQSTCARVRVREGLSPIRDHESYFRAWRVAKFGGDFDPIRVAVDEAAMAFLSGKSEKGKASDRRVWLKIANRVGLSGFLDAFEQKAIMRDCRRALCARGLLYRQGRVQRGGHEDVPILRNFRRAD